MLENYLGGPGPRELESFLAQLAREAEEQALDEGLHLETDYDLAPDEGATLEHLCSYLESALGAGQTELDLISPDDGQSFELRDENKVRERLSHESQQLLVATLDRITEKRVGVFHFHYNGKPYEAWIVFPEKPGAKLSISLAPLTP